MAKKSITLNKEYVDSNNEDIIVGAIEFKDIQLTEDDNILQCVVFQNYYNDAIDICSLDSFSNRFKEVE